MNGLDQLGEYLEKAMGGERSGHLYIKRTGTPGYYKYEYAQAHEPGAMSVHDAAKQDLSERHASMKAPIHAKVEDYVNANIELWAQNNAYGKRINATLLVVQFSKDGEPFGEGGSSASVNDFDSVDDDEDF
mgnify:CR=1 FL=1